MHWLGFHKQVCRIAAGAERGPTCEVHGNMLMTRGRWATEVALATGKVELHHRLHLPDASTLHPALHLTLREIERCCRSDDMSSGCWPEEPSAQGCPAGGPQTLGADECRHTLEISSKSGSIQPVSARAASYTAMVRRICGGASVSSDACMTVVQDCFKSSGQNLLTQLFIQSATQTCLITQRCCAASAAAPL